jgi:hypothetical protein
MADDQEERSFEVVKLRIAFLQHITTLSGAAILIVLALIQRAETPKGAYELAIAVPWFVVIPYRFIDGIMRTCQRYSTPR